MNGSAGTEDLSGAESKSSKLSCIWSSFAGGLPTISAKCTVCTPQDCVRLAGRPAAREHGSALRTLGEPGLNRHQAFGDVVREGRLAVVGSFLPPYGLDPVGNRGLAEIG